MLHYLNETVNKLKSRHYADLIIVLGNESCDLDSAVSAVVFATFLYWKYKKLKLEVCTRSKRDENTYKDNVYVPVLNVNREDYALKSEVAFAFNEHGIQESDLVFRDDIDLKNMVKNTKISVILVDHHIPSKRDKYLIPYVTEIIDHRPVDKVQWQYQEDTRSTIEIVGSCSTLVAQRILDLSAFMSKDIQFFKDFPVCTELLLCTIILDTVNFSKEVKKATRHDEEIANFLENILQIKNSENQRKHKLARYLEVRTNVSTLTSAQLLRKDTKIIGDVYIPSFPILVKEFLQKSDALEIVSATLVRSGCSVALLLGMSLVGTLQRDAAVFSPEQSRAAMLSSHLQQWTDPPLQLSIEDLQHPLGCYYFNQLNLSVSRKQYIPAVNRFLEHADV